MKNMIITKKVVKNIMLLFIFLLTLQLVHGAIIKGDVYDIDFEHSKGAVIEINTEPKQQKVITNGSYQFEVPLGKYTLAAKVVKNNMLVATEEENITIKQDGIFNLDLVLFPDFGEEMDLLTEAQENISVMDLPEEAGETTSNENKWVWWLGLFVLGLIILILSTFQRRKTDKKDLDGKNWIKDKKHLSEKIEKPIANSEAELKDYIDFIKKEKRITQKDMRKHFPVSEAKISLILAELEDKGLVKKIKKGRGNIIIWNEK